MKKLIIIFTSIAVLFLLFFYLEWQDRSQDRSDCVCTVLTEHETRHPISPILNSVWDMDSAAKGSFIRLLTTCEHEKRICITIFPDEGFFVGYIVR